MDEKEFNKEWKDGEIVKYAENYDENAFWEKLKKFGRKAGIKVCYAALLLYYVLKSPLTSGKDRAKIIGALGYFLLPMPPRNCTNGSVTSMTSYSTFSSRSTISASAPRA